jgi:hypothetical protein
VSFQFPWLGYPELDQIPAPSGHKVAFLNAYAITPLGDQAFHICIGTGKHPEEGNERPADSGGVHCCVVAGQDARRLELPHSLEDRRSTEADGLTKLLIAQPGIGLKQGK